MNGLIGWFVEVSLLVGVFIGGLLYDMKRGRCIVFIWARLVAHRGRYQVDVGTR